MADLGTSQIPVYATIPKTGVGVLNAASAGAMNSTSNAVTIVTAGANGAVVDSLLANTTDTSAVSLFLFIVGSDGITVKPLFQVNVPLRSGDLASTLNVDCLDPSVSRGAPVDNSGKRIIRLAASERLMASVLANMTATKICAITAMYLDI